MQPSHDAAISRWNTESQRLDDPLTSIFKTGKQQLISLLSDMSCQVVMALHTHKWNDDAPPTYPTTRLLSSLIGDYAVRIMTVGL